MQSVTCEHHGGGIAFGTFDDRYEFVGRKIDRFYLVNGHIGRGRRFGEQLVAAQKRFELEPSEYAFYVGGEGKFEFAFVERIGNRYVAQYLRKLLGKIRVVLARD